MFYIATYDVGTTAVKGVLVREDGEIETSQSVQIKTCFDGGYKEQDPEEWFAAFCEIGKKFTSAVDPESIGAIIMSGQMQDLILVDRNGDPLRKAILYSDLRAEEEAGEIMSLVGNSRLMDITGNNFDGSLPIAKLMWVKKREPLIYQQTHKVLISSKDFIVNRLTGIACGDYTACSTAGAMNLASGVWDSELIRSLNLREKLFPALKYPHEKVGTVKADMEGLCGYRSSTRVYAGIGDAGATTLASGISGAGEYNINVGTSGWVAAISNEVMNLKGRVFNLAGFAENTYINVVPFFNAGNVHKWITKIFSETEEPDYGKISDILNDSEVASHDLLFLPYLTGERFPVVDAKIKGCYYGITPDTSRADMVRACLEGVAFSIRQGMELISKDQKSISMIGGGAREPHWCQLMADILGKDITVYKNSDLMPSKALAAAVLLGDGMIADYRQFIDKLQDDKNCTIYKPNDENHELYSQRYEVFKKLYPCLREGKLF